jgi:hypothetical protein
MLNFLQLCSCMLLLLNPPLAEAQGNKANDSDPWGLHFSGFIKNDFWFDTRQVYTSREDLFLFYPLNKSLDAEGKDINSDAVFNFSAMTTRLTANVSIPDVMGAKVNAVIEGDFSGVSNNDINGFRLRHAYGKMTWKHAEMLMGQYWHPLFTPEVSPGIASLNTGAPFQPFNRTPLVSVTGIFGKFRIFGAFITQRDNASDGPFGATSSYMRNAVVPNLHLQFQFKSSHHMAGIGGDYKLIKPLQVINDAVAKGKLGSYSFLAYYKMNYGDLSIKIKGVYGQNLTEHLMLGGYAQLPFDSSGTDYHYTPTQHIFTWAQLSFGKKYQGYLFGGYAKNLGTIQENIGAYFARGKDLAWLYRVSPGFSCTFDKLQCNVEAEYTVAGYGTPAAKGIVENVTPIPNLRLLLTVFYYF